MRIKVQSIRIRTYCCEVRGEHQANTTRDSHVSLARLDALHSHMRGHKTGRASRGDSGARAVDVEEVRYTVGDHLLTRAEEVVLWVLHEVPDHGVPVVADRGADVARGLGAPDVLQAEVGVLERLVRDLHRYPLLRVQGDSLGRCDVEEGRVVDVRVFLEEVSALGGDDVGACRVRVVEGVRVPPARR